MSFFESPDRNETDSIVSDSIVSDSTRSKSEVFRALGAALQLLAIGFCLESMLGVADGMGVLLRIALIALIMFCIVLRLGWLSLVALQVNLFVLEPRRQPLEQAPSAFFFILLACCLIVFAMNLPQIHRFVTDYFLRLLLAVANDGNSDRTPAKSGSPKTLTVLGSRFAIRALQMVSSVVLGIFLLTCIPIGRQSSSWLQWSRDNGQAVWPGSLLLILMIGLLVLARENAWRQIASSQARLYLRSQQLIANFRDLLSFERMRLKAAARLSTSKSRLPEAKKQSNKKEML